MSSVFANARLNIESRKSFAKFAHPMKETWSGGTSPKLVNAQLTLMKGT